MNMYHESWTMNMYHRTKAYILFYYKPKVRRKNE